MGKIKEMIKKLPQSPGVYFFKDATGRILYIGKAIILKDRVRSHFAKNGNAFKGDLIRRIDNIDWIETDDEKQALILENDLIKKYKPRYNVQWRDDKSYFWVSFSDDEWPRIQIIHHKQIKNKKGELKTVPIGPFTNGQELRKVLRALRKILPYRTCQNPYNKPCLQWHLGLCPAHNLSILLPKRKARQKPTVPTLPRYAGPRSKKELKKYLNSLNTLTQFLRLYANEAIRIEAYDISNIQGVWATGSMIVFQGDKPNKNDYRKFKIKTIRGANDVAMIKEILTRRFGHPEWPCPDLILIDGGRAQLEAAKSAIKNFGAEIALLALAKKEEEIYTKNSDKTLNLQFLPIRLRLLFQAVRDEAHRFAVFYYRHLHEKQYRPTKSSKKT